MWKLSSFIVIFFEKNHRCNVLRGKTKIKQISFFWTVNWFATVTLNGFVPNFVQRFSFSMYLLFLAFSLNKNGKYCGSFPTRVVMVNLFRPFERLSWESERDLPDLLTFFLVKDSTWFCSLALTSSSQCFNSSVKNYSDWYCDFLNSFSPWEGRVELILWLFQVLVP